MARYLMSVCYPEGSTAPSPEELEQITRDVTEVHDALASQGSWVFGGGLHDPSASTVVTARDGSTVTHDGPFVETKEVIGGLSIIDVPDLDDALRWAERMSAATTCPIEVRPFVDGP
ncbi:YciI family protein [Actinomarinicola tropica]|uniref:YciI family protein n=1 Tax=Actinomarinicola tropica TaxID=2789776 RepID=UPI001E3B4102|nr:YciI family protein [Actinomarinicola tropica]